jgi:hypothetical protein
MAAEGRPLSGNAAKIANAAANFPENLQGGVVRARHAAAFGTGPVMLTRVNPATGVWTPSTLDLGGLAVANAVDYRQGRLAGFAGYVGSLTISAPTPEFADAGTVGGTVALTDGVTLGSPNLFTGPVTTVAGVTLAPAGTSGTLRFGGGLMLAGGTTLALDLGASSDRVLVSGGTITGPASGLVTIIPIEGAGFGQGDYPLIDWNGATAIGVDLNGFVFGPLPSGYAGELRIDGATLVLGVRATSLSAWRASYGLPVDGSQDLIAPAGDGVAYLLKYAFNLLGSGPGQVASLTLPNTSTLTSEGSAGLPRVLLISTGPDSGKLAVTYIRRKAIMNPGVTYAVEFAGGDFVFAGNPAAGESVTSLDSVFERVTVMDNTPVTERRFARVRVTVQ